MSIERTQNELFKRLKQDILFRWHTETRIGNDGSAGNTLEDLLGIEENNLKIPDWGDIELKTRKKDSQSLITLKHMEPKPDAYVPKLVKSLGWKHKNAGTKYGDNEMSFRSTTRSDFSVRGFAVSLDQDKVNFVFDPNKVSRTKKDKTNIYDTYGDWLDDVLNRSPNYTEFFPIYWDREDLETQLRDKLEKTLFVTCKTKKDGAIRSFFYDNAVLLSGFDKDKIDTLFQSNALVVDFDARTNHNHGTKFRVDLKHLPDLFNKSESLFE